MPVDLARLAVTGDVDFLNICSKGSVSRETQKILVLLFLLLLLYDNPKKILIPIDTARRSWRWIR